MTEFRTILVTGATGHVGRQVLAGLLAGGTPAAGVPVRTAVRTTVPTAVPTAVRAMVREPAATDLPPQVQVVRGDLTDPSSVAAAARGADAAFLLWPSYTPAGALEVVEALAQEVPRLVYLSAASVQDDRPIASNGVWGTVEHLIEQTELGWTFLRAGGFATNTLQWSGAIRSGDRLRIPYPAAGRSLIHERDIAAVAVRALLDESHVGRKYVLTGPETLTQAEQIATIGSVIGKHLRAEDQPFDEARQELTAALGAEFADNALAYWATLVDHPEGVTRTVQDVTGQPARTFRDWAIDHADDFR